MFQNRFFSHIIFWTLFPKRFKYSAERVRFERGDLGLLTKTSELREREVVNVLDGRRLGLASDLEIEMETGKIKAIVVPGPGKFLWLFGKSEDFVIPWEKIIKVGLDVILVEAPDYVLEQPASD